MKILESAENYLETILVLKKSLGNVRSIDIANKLAFSKPSVSIAMKRLKENNYIKISPKGYITLNESGLEIAEKIYERHKVLAEHFISIGVDKKTANADACRIEHVISKTTFEKIKEHAKK